MNRRTVLALTSAALLNNRPAVAQQSQRFVVQNNYWALPGKAEEVFQWRIHACDVLDRLGLPRGEVLRRQGNSETLPDVIWQIEYQSEEERRLARLKEDGPEFQEVVEHMRTLTRRFEQSVWRPN
jgi:hypothetical protein